MSHNNNMSKSVSSELKKRVLLVACLISATGALLVNIMPIFLGSAAEHMNLNDQQIGVVGSAFLAGFALVSISSPFWISRLDWKRLAYGSFASIIPLMLLCAVFDQFYPLVVLLVLIGVGCGFLYTLGVAIIAQSSCPDRFFGWKLMCEIVAGIFLMLVLPNFVMGKWGYPGVAVAIGLVFALFAVLFVWLRENVCANEPQTPEPDLYGSEESAHPNMPVWLGLLSLLVHFIGVNGVWAFIERIGDDLGISAADIGSILSLSLVLGGLGAMIAGIIGDRFGRALPLVIGKGGMLVAMLLLATQRDSLSYTLAVCLIMGLWPLVLSYQMGVIACADSSGRLAVLISGAISLGGAIGPAVAGMIKTGDSYLPLYWMMGSLTLVSLLVFCRLAAYLSKKQDTHAYRPVDPTQ